MKIEFQGFNPFIKQLRSDRGWRVEIDVSQSEYENIKNLPLLQDQNLKITIENEEFQIT